MTVTKNTTKLQMLIQTTPQRADAFLRGVAEEMVSDIKLSFGSGEQTGPVTRDSRGRFVAGHKFHQASEPGEPPNVDTGTLRASMGWQPDGPLRILIHDGVIYGLPLEIGTAHMAARPFVAPVFEEWRQRKLATFASNFGLFD